MRSAKIQFRKACRHWGHLVEERARLVSRLEMVDESLSHARERVAKFKTNRKPEEIYGE